MTAPEAGWYVDPENAGQLRWWSGAEWTEHKQLLPTQPAPVPEVPVPEVQAYVPMGSYHAGSTATLTEPAKLKRGEKDRLVRKNNSLGYVGCLLAIISILVNPFAILSILAIVFSSIGLARANALEGRSKVTGRGTSAAGLIIGILVLAYFCWAIARLSLQL